MAGNLVEPRPRGQGLGWQVLIDILLHADLPGTKHARGGGTAALFYPQDFNQGSPGSWEMAQLHLLELSSPPSLQCQPHTSQLSCLILCTTNPLHLPLPEQLLGHKPTQGSLSPLLATHTTLLPSPVSHPETSV